MEQGIFFTELMNKYNMADFSSITHDRYIADLIQKNKTELPFKRVPSLELLPEVWETVAFYCVDDLQRKFMDEAFIFRRSLLREGHYQNKLEFLAFLSVDALVSQRNSELRLVLREQKVDSLLDNSKLINWALRVKETIIYAFLLLCRKNEWGDIENAKKSIKILQESQKYFEESYLHSNTLTSIDNAAAELIILYNLSRIIELSAEYLFDGKTGADKSLSLMQRQYRNITEVNNKLNAEIYNHLSRMIYFGCKFLVENSVWASTSTLGAKVKEYLENLKVAKPDHQIIELWPSQKEALNNELLDPAKKTIILEMPTSSGKTLMAEFSILNSLVLNPNSKVLYIAPTKALVSQISIKLRAMFNTVGYIVESAAPAFELDPTENKMLEGKVDILVSTPEKIDLLFKTKHPAVQNLSLVVIDEAHNISDEERGGKLEFLLSNIARESKDTRFLLLSPFIPNAKELAKWLGKEKSAEISIRWKPSERITGVAYPKKIGKDYQLLIKMLPSAHSDIKREFDLVLDDNIGNKTTLNEIAIETALQMNKRNENVLFLCASREKTEEYSKSIFDKLKDKELDEFTRLVIEFLEDEYGNDHILPKLIKRGIAFHHAGLSPESKFLIERLVEKGKIGILFATTTLAQGVNLPISTIIVESLYRYTRRKGNLTIPVSEFWNIAGRAGRANSDHFGSIIFVANNKKQIETYKKYLQEEAKDVVSALFEALKKISITQETLDLKMIVADYPALNQFIQYLLHAIIISGYSEVSSGIEEVLKSSLAYNQIRDLDEKQAEKLLHIAREYIKFTSKVGLNEPYLNLIDGTGFSSYTVSMLFNKRIEDINAWKDTSIFNKDNTNLRNFLNVIKDIPEIRIGEEIPIKLNLNRISGIIKDWVNGATIPEIAKDYFDFETKDKVLSASRYLHTKVANDISWGLNAFQRVSLFGKDVDWQEYGYAPAFIYFGVNDKYAVTLRMLGVPRASAQSLSEELKEYQKKSGEKQLSFQDIRNWLNDIDDQKWTPKRKTNLSGKRYKELWRYFAGLKN